MSSQKKGGQPEPEYEEYFDDDYVSGFREDGRSKKKLVSVDGEYFHAYLPAPVDGKYPAGMLSEEPALPYNYGPAPKAQPAKAKAASATSTSTGPKATTGQGQGAAGSSGKKK